MCSKWSIIKVDDRHYLYSRKLYNNNARWAIIHFCCNPSRPEGTFQGFQIQSTSSEGEEEEAELNSSAVTGAGLCWKVVVVFPLLCSFKWWLDQNSPTEEHKKATKQLWIWKYHPYTEQSQNLSLFFLFFNTEMLFEMSKRIKTLHFSRPLIGLLCRSGEKSSDWSAVNGGRDHSADWNPMDWSDVRMVPDAKLLCQLLVFFMLWIHFSRSLCYTIDHFGF